MKLTQRRKWMLLASPRYAIRSGRSVTADDGAPLVVDPTLLSRAGELGPPGLLTGAARGLDRWG
jgi:hypothetical protein